MKVAPEIYPTSMKRFTSDNLGKEMSPSLNTQDTKNKDLSPGNSSDFPSKIHICQEKYKKIIVHPIYLIFLAVIYSYSLIYDDLRIMLLSRGTNTISFIFNIIIFTILLFDMLLNTFFIKGYILSVYFYIDIISTISLLLKIDWIIPASNQIIKITLSLLSKTRITSFIKIGNRFFGNEKLQDQNAKSKKGSHRSSKKIVIPFHSMAASPNALFKANQNNNTIEEEGEDIKEETQKNTEEITKHSKIGKMIKTVYEKKIIIFILIFFYIISYLDPYNYSSYPNTYSQSLEYLNQISNEQNNIAYNYYLTSLFNDSVTNYEQILYIKTPGTFEESLPLNISNIQKENFLKFSYLNQYELYLSTKRLSTIFYIISIVKTIFFVLLIIFSKQFILSDSNTIILLSLEKMIEKYKDYVKNPLSFIHNEDKDNQNKNKNKNIQNLNTGSDSNGNSRLENEKMKLESTIINFGKLLSICFGEAGSQIIEENIKGNAYINPFKQGNKIDAIIMFSHIRHFQEISETFKNKIFPFVNFIAQYLHPIIKANKGFINKNLGDGFLCLWKPDASNFGDNFNLQDIKIIQSDYALYSALKILYKINIQFAASQYKTFKEIRNNFFKNNESWLGIGLHIGWAVEGAIGSYHKIDASYLSPNVNLAARLESVTHQYGVNILFSDEFYNNLSPVLQKYCRRIDRVTLKGSANIIDLYTVILDYPKDSNNNNNIALKKALTFSGNVKNLDEDKFKELTFSEFECKLLSKILNDWHINYLFRDTLKNEREHLKKYNEALLKYINGDWKEALQIFQSDPLKNWDDPPKENILKFMSQTDNVAPKDWKNFRPLTEK